MLIERMLFWKDQRLTGCKCVGIDYRIRLVETFETRCMIRY